MANNRLVARVLVLAVSPTIENNLKVLKFCYTRNRTIYPSIQALIKSVQSRFVELIAEVNLIQDGELKKQLESEVEFEVLRVAKRIRLL